jgi:hypothetical protein
MARAQKSKESQRPAHKPLSANLTGLVEPALSSVDFRAGEPYLAKAPIRPAKWKAKPAYSGDLSVKIRRAPDMQAEVPLKVTLVRAHRPRKAAQTHVKRTKSSKRVMEGVVFDQAPAGDYALICQVKGYRPYIEFVQFTRRKGTFEIGFPFHPVHTPEEEEDLLRPGESHPFLENTHNFLRRFGYLAKTLEEPEVLSEEMSGALRRFQRAFGLRESGTLSVETLELMLQPRCAVPDILPDRPLALSAGPPGVDSSDPIVFMGNRWDSFNLRYRLFDGTADISNEWPLVRSAMERWGQVSPLTFREVSSGDSDLEFDFRRPSESGYPFDEGGNKDGNTLAHAWGPLNGTVEFDDHEDWGSTSLPAVATHEIGHALGLAHSGVNDATMYPWYDSAWDSLHEVDVRGIRSLYAPVYRHSGPFISYPLYAFQSRGGTDSVTIDLGAVRRFLAWGTITMIDSLIDLDRDNMTFIDVYEVDGNRTGWRVSGGDHFGSDNSPANVYEGAFVGYGRRITFRITAGNVGDLEASGHAIVLVLS